MADRGQRPPGAIVDGVRLTYGGRPFGTYVVRHGDHWHILRGERLGPAIPSREAMTRKLGPGWEALP